MNESLPKNGDGKPGLPLHFKILLGLLVGVSCGLLAHWYFHVEGSSELDVDKNGLDDRLDWFTTHVFDTVGKIFLRIVFMVVIPLVMSALALGVVGIGDVRQLGRVGLRTLGMTALFSTCAVLIGIGLVNALQPGSRLPPEKRDRLREQYSSNSKTAVEKAKQAKPAKDVILDMIPENPLQEMVGALDGSSKGNGMLAVMFFSLMTGIAITLAGDKCQVLVGWLEGVFEASMVIIGLAMKLAPFAVACLVFSITARLGYGILGTLAWFVITVTLGLALQLFVVYPLAILVIGRMSPIFFFRSVSEAMLTAFGTSSSNATLPTALRVAEQNLKIPREISSFVLTIGATGNQNGTALYEGVVVLFLAQVFGIELTVTQQFTVVLMSVLAGVGTAGVPGGSIPMIVSVMQTVGVPGESIGIILGIDRLLDMLRTVLNVTGDLAIAACVGGSASTEQTPSES